MRVDDNLLDRMPPAELLESVAPIKIWYKAMSRASSCVHKRHRTGCVIFDPTQRDNVIAAGVAHPIEGLAIRSIHAERDALSKLQQSYRYDLDLIVVTLTRVGNFASISRPCVDCATAIVESRAINRVIYAERANDDSWTVRYEQPANLLSWPLRRTSFN